jgi:hypothetical protein
MLLDELGRDFGNAVIAIVTTSAGAVGCLYRWFLMDTGAPRHTLHCYR